MAISKLKVFAAAASVMAMAVTSAVQAAPVVQEIVISKDLQKTLDKDYGAKEADFLKKDLREAVERSLDKSGATKVAYVKLTIDEAKPNRPTFYQTSKNTSLSYGDSRSLGGARVEAQLYDSSGALLSTVKHKYFTFNLDDVIAQSTWSDEQRAFDSAAYKIRREAEKAG
ncbi:MAG: hypothetical protein ABWZ40_14095 [Caulobacterales bacterium]